MNERLLNELYNEIRRFRLAEADMEMALAAARHLANLDRPLTPMDRSIETGLVVSFARVFRNSKIGTLDEEDWGPPPGDEWIADVLLNLRDKMYAHSDTPWRAIADVGGADGPSYSEAYYTLETYVDYPSLIAVIEPMMERFRKFAESREAFVRAAMPSVDWREAHANPRPAGPLDSPAMQQTPLDE